MKFTATIQFCKVYEITIEATDHKDAAKQANKRIRDGRMNGLDLQYESWDVLDIEQIAQNVGDMRIEKIGFSYEVQRWSARNYDGYYCQDWRTVATFCSEEEATRYIEEVQQNGR